MATTKATTLAHGQAGSIVSGTFPTARIADDAITLDKLAHLGTDGHVLTSTGTGSAPAFEAIPSSGVTHASTWRLTSNLTGSAAPISSNLAEAVVDGYTRKGSALTQSSGVFTFPVTGLWFITFQSYAEINGDSRRNIIYIKTTHNNSTWVEASSNRYHIQQTSGDYTAGGAFTSVLFTVSDVSNYKVRFEINVDNSSVDTKGGTATATGMNFIRLGDA